jgi:hypothetical protein
VPASQALINQANTTVASGNIGQIFNFLSTTPIQPPSGGLTGLNVDAKAKTATGGNLGDADFGQVKLLYPMDRIAFIKFVGDPAFPATLSFQVQYATTLRTTASRAGWIPIWFLPWDSKRVLKMKIEDYTTPTLPAYGTGPAPAVAIDPLPNPGVFFTAAINGCSVFAIGGTRSPSVYHAGITGSMEKQMTATNFTALGGTSEAAWRNLVEGSFFDNAGNIKPKTPAQHQHGTTKQARHPHFGEVNRSDYVAERLTSGKVLSRGKLPDGAPKLTTSKAVELEKKLEKTNGITEVGVNPWGAVFGVRDTTGNWSFYLVKNATIGYKRYRWHKLGIIPYNRTKDPTTYNVINLGHLQFFPGRGETHYRDFNVKALV